MAQTTAALPRGKYQVEISTDGTTWVDISGQAAAVSQSEGQRLVGRQFTADGTYPVVLDGEIVDATTTEVRYVYTESSGEALETLEGRSTIYVRFSPAGGSSGDKEYTASDDAGSAFACPIVSNLPPDLDSGSPDAAIGVLRVVAPQYVVADHV